MIVGYARTSTIEQAAGLEAQQRALTAAGCERLFIEQASSVGSRPILITALEFVRGGDVFVVTKLDRLARSMAHLLQVVQTLRQKGVAFKVLDADIDTSKPTGTLIMHILAAMAQFEREIMLERQRSGIARAKAEGKFKGRRGVVTLYADKIAEMHASGVSIRRIAREIGVHPSNVSRKLKRMKEDCGDA